MLSSIVGGAVYRGRVRVGGGGKVGEVIKIKGVSAHTLTRKQYWTVYVQTKTQLAHRPRPINNSQP